MADLNTVSREQALEIILESIDPLETITLPLEEALHHVACEDLYAPHDIPPFDRAAMDGYAICSKDTAHATDEHPARLKVVGEIRPRIGELPALLRGQAMRIATGGPIPPGADAVVKEEDTSCDLNTLEVATVVSPFQYVSKRGKDIKKSSLIVERGGRITPPVLGTLASLQIRKTPVTRRPLVSVIAVGNELIDLGARPADHRIVASNIYMLSAMVKEHGGLVGQVMICTDDADTIKSDLEKGLNSDMVITTGGTSNARSDLTRRLMEKMGVDVKFSGLSMVPGKGTSFGMDQGKPVFCLPGTPSAVYAAFYTLIVPALLRLMGQTDRMVPIKATLERDLEKRPGIEHLVQGLVRNEGSAYRVLPLAGPHTGAFSAMAMANGLILVAPDKSRLHKGESVLVQPLPAFQAPLSGKGLPEQEETRGQKAAPPMVSVVGKSDSGKTTLLEKLVPALTARGYGVGTIKHDVHGFDIDHEGKDSWRHKRAGAHTVAISSPKKVSVIRDVQTEETLDGLALKYFQDVDIILTEGYKKQDKPKIEVFRSQAHDNPLCTKDEHLVALVSDIPLDLGVPRFELDDVQGLADLVEQTFLTKPFHLRN
ncbi:MAG: molybdopterin-guanine dinucleotide biosynthesis protein B [Thermodesulfobacteriota bacterium]|nr:molybdopterin-guanine dinucleotide biosynthesis protein B [Thermodesulfobacteriota bacterium]